MTTRNVNLLWKSFKGIRKLNTINSDQEFGADIAHGVRLSKEKSGQFRSIRSSGWFSPAFICGSTSIAQTTGTSLSDITVQDIKFSYKANVSGSGTVVFTFDGDVWKDANNEEVNLVDFGISYSGDPVATDELTVTYDYQDVIRLFSANISGVAASDQLIAFTKDTVNSKINVWKIYDSTSDATQTKIAEFPLTTDVTDVCMAQWGDRLGMVVAFGANYLGFVFYASLTPTDIPTATQMPGTNWYYITIDLSGGGVTTFPIENITRVKPYRSRLAVNGETTYSTGGQTREAIYGVWFSEAGNLTNFSMDSLTSATDVSAFYVETGERVEQLEEYHGLTAFCRNRSYNITGSSQNDIKVMPLTAKGVFGNATFTMNGQCAYVDSWSNNMFTLRDNIDGTIGFNDPIGDDIQDYLTDIKDVTVTSLGRRVRMAKSNGQSLIYDVDIGEWTEETLPQNSRVVTFLNTEYLCQGSQYILSISEQWTVGSTQLPDDNEYYSHYRTNLIWLDSQSSVKSHLYPFAVILEPQTSNNFYITFTTDRGDSISAKITRAGFTNIATYSNNDTVPEDGSQFVNSDDDLSGRIFFAMTETELLVTVERPPFWRYLQIDIYTTDSAQQFNISGIEAKNTVVTDEMLDY